ncbi:MAG: SBBP repeat-containing protein, partial [Candidatus Hodarchaeales archaeon]
MILNPFAVGMNFDDQRVDSMKIRSIMVLLVMALLLLSLFLGTTFQTVKNFSETDSLDSPDIAGSINNHQLGNNKLHESSQNLSLLYSSYLGGSLSEFAWSFVLDDDNNMYFAGRSNSDDFPTTQNAYLRERPDGEWGIFIAKLSADGSTLLFSTWLGSSSCCEWNPRTLPNIALDSSNNIIISGVTDSDSFPTTTNAYNRSRSGATDIYLAKLSANGSTLFYSTFFGGSNSEFSGGLGLDIDGNIYVTGATISSDFPITTNAYDPTYNGNQDIFITKFLADNFSLDYSTYLGGNESEETLATSVSFDSANNLILTGDTLSSNYPTTANAYNRTFLGGSMVPPAGEPICCGDIVVSKLSVNGSILLYSTFLGGSQGEKPHGIVVDNTDNIYLTGSTNSPDFPTATNAFDSNYNGDTS